MTLLIAILGIVGTLSGVIFTQFWNSYAEKNRWKLERGRQLETDSREDGNRTYDHRREAYVNFLRELERLRRSYTDRNNPPKPPYEIFDALWDLWTVVMVYGSAEVQEIAEQCSEAFGILQSSWGTDTGDSIIEEVLDSWHQLLTQVRSDLGVSEPDNESQPAAIN